jgi:cytochrome c biogenesis protein CcmG/thiol:disulfide interchange protein DsbE
MPDLPALDPPASRAHAPEDLAPNQPEEHRPGFRIGRLLALLCAVAFIGLLGYGLLTAAPDDSIDQALAEGTPAAAPGFELPVLQQGELPPRLAAQLEQAAADGNIALDELSGVPVVLNFWASWCGPCREEAPLLERAWRQTGPKGVLFLGLDMQDLTEDARGFLGEFGNTYPVVRDQGDEVANDWGVTGVPETFFLAADGTVTSHVIGVVSEEQISNGIRTARSGQTLAPLSGGSQRPTR